MALEEKKSTTYHYFDTPDGEDTFKKLWAVLKPTIPTAAYIAWADLILISRPKGYYNSLIRFSGVSLPILGFVSTFVLTTNSIASLRKKDDHWNWFIGGFVTGSTLGFMKRNTFIGFNCGMFFGLAAALRKEYQLRNWTIIPDKYIGLKGPASFSLHNYSMYAERPKNWTTGNKDEC